MQTSKKPTVLITGAARNIGFATAKLFAENGYNVCITSRKRPAAEDAAAKLENCRAGITACGYEMDTGSIESIRNVFGALYERFGRLDVFVPNATDPGYNQSILTTTPEQYDFVMSCNARGYFFCCQEAAKIMVKQSSGSIVVVGSIHSKGALPNRITYAMSKGAIDVLARNMSYELGKFGIRANVVVVGATYNDRWEGMTEADYARKRENWPLGRESYPEDIANAVYFLASEKARTITGCELRVDSGLMTCLLKYDKDWDEKIDERVYKLK